MSFFGGKLREWMASKGYDVRRIDLQQVIPENIPDPELYQRPDQTVRLFRPWLSPAYDAWFTPEVLANTMLGRHKLYNLLQFVRQTMPLKGDIFEAGVGSGGSARLMLNCCLSAKAPRRMWLLDTFAGYQKIDREKDGEHVKLNQCQCQDRAHVVELLKNNLIEVNAIEGLIPGTLAQVHSDAICFAHIDVNLYEPTLAATEFCLERMPAGGIIVFDDYSWPATYGARSAIDEACQKRGQQVICLAESTQAFLIKR